jgi:hypothetical protein
MEPEVSLLLPKENASGLTARHLNPVHTPTLSSFQKTSSMIGPSALRSLGVFLL